MADPKRISVSLDGLLSPFCDPIARRVGAKYFPTLDADKDNTASDPWVQSRYFGIGLLELAGNSYADYQSLINGKHSLDEVWGRIQKHFPRHILSLGPFADGDPSGPLSVAWAKELGLRLHTVELPGAPVLELTGTWQEYQDGKRGKFWYNINRAERLLAAEFGPLQFSIARSADEIVAHLPSCLALYRGNWSRLTSRSVFITELGQRMLRELMVELSSRGKAELVRLEQGGKLLGFSVGITIESSYYFYIFATNKRQEYERFSVGKIFIRKLLESVFERSFRMFDFMAGQEPYKFEWTRTFRSRTLYWIVPDQLSSRALLSSLILFRDLERSLKSSNVVRTTLRRAANLLRPNDNSGTEHNPH